jgi:hypothetical protein
MSTPLLGQPASTCWSREYLEAPDGVGGDESTSAGLARTGAQAVGLIRLGAPAALR